MSCSIPPVSVGATSIPEFPSTDYVSHLGPTLALVNDRALLSAAARDIRDLMKRRQVTEQAALLEADPSAWARPDPELEALAVEIDEVMYGRRRQMPGLLESIAEMLGDDWDARSFGQTTPKPSVPGISLPRIRT